MNTILATPPTSPAPQDSSFDENEADKISHWKLLKLSARDTGLILYARWSMIRSRPVRLLIYLCVILFMFSLYSAMNLGYLAQIAAEQGGDSIQGIYASTWISSLNNGYMASVGSLAVGGAVAVALFAPFTGTSTASLVSSDDLATVRPTKSHRYFDALLINAVSGIGLIQFITLSAITSLITLDGNRLAAMLLTWCLWAFLITINTMIGFFLEWMFRRYGRLQRAILGLTGAAVLATLILVDDKHGQDLFGASEKYTSALRLSVNGWNPLSAVYILVFVLATSAAIWAGSWFAGLALKLPPGVTNGTKAHKTKRFSPIALIATTKLLLRTIWRTKECRRPMLAIFLIGLPVAFFTSFDGTVAVALMISAPIAVALSWAMNVYGVLGRGMNWVASQPRLMGRLPQSAALTQFFMACGLNMMLWAVSWLSGRSTASSGMRLLLGTIIVATLTTGLSSLFSVYNPLRAPLTGRGDSLVPPLTALGYLTVLLLLGCVPAVVIGQLESVQQVYLLTAVSALVGILLVFVALLSWRSPDRRAKVAMLVSVD